MSVITSSETSARPMILGAAAQHLPPHTGPHSTLGPSSAAASYLEPGMGLGIPAAGRENLSHRAYLRIRSSLIHSELRPGQKLVLRPLAAELRLSPTPVREALLRLVSEQALTLDERGSAIVPVIGLDEFREIIDIRCDLEGRAAARAATRAGPREIEQIVALVRACHLAVEANDRPTILSRNAELHRAVCRIAHAPLILRILEGIWMRIGPVYALKLEAASTPAPADIHPYDQLVAALLRHDAEAARAAAVADVRASSDWLEQSLISAAG